VAAGQYPAGQGQDRVIQPKRHGEGRPELPTRIGTSPSMPAGSAATTWAAAARTEPLEARPPSGTQRHAPASAPIGSTTTMATATA
jgi:hypothetical protein